MELSFLIAEVERALFLASLFSAAFLIPIFFSATLMGLFQALTSIQDQILSFAPKLITGMLLLYFASPWMLQKMQLFCGELFHLLGESR